MNERPDPTQDISNVRISSSLDESSGSITAGRSEDRQHNEQDYTLLTVPGGGKRHKDSVSSGNSVILSLHSDGESDDDVCGDNRSARDRSHQSRSPCPYCRRGQARGQMGSQSPSRQLIYVDGTEHRRESTADQQHIAQTESTTAREESSTAGPAEHEDSSFLRVPEKTQARGSVSSHGSSDSYSFHSDGDGSPRGQQSRSPCRHCRRGQVQGHSLREDIPPGLHDQPRDGDHNIL